MKTKQTAGDARLFYRQVFALVIPMALQNLINVAVSSADVIMLGKVGETALSASSLANQMQFILTLIFFGLTSGACVLTAQYWGKGDTRTIEKIMGIALRMALAAAALFTAAVQLFPRQCMLIYTSEEPVIAQGVDYLRIVSLSYLLMSVTAVYLNIMRSVERVVVSTVVYSLSLLTNIVCNAVLIFGLLGFPAMGIRGAAVGTLTARALELILVLCYARRNRTVRLRLKDLFTGSRVLQRDFLTFSIPVILNELMWGAGASMTAVVVGHLGSSAVAANSVAQVARQLATVVAFGVANAAAVMLGKAIGEQNEAKALEDSRRFVRLTLAAGVCGAGVILAVRPVVMAALSLTPKAREYLSMMMFVMSYFVVAQAYNTTVVVGILRAGGDTKFGLYEDVGTMWLLSIPLGALFAFVFHLSVPAVYVALCSDELLKIPFSLWRCRTNKWLRNITRPAEEAR